MAYSYHPFPLIRAAKSALVTILLLILIYLVRDYVSDILLPLILVIVAFGIMSVLSAFAVASTYMITLGDDNITYRFGVLSRTEYNLPYSKITESRFSQGIIDQFVGLGTMTLDTAGFTDIPLHIRDIRLSDIKKTQDAINGANKKT